MGVWGLSRDRVTYSVGGLTCNFMSSVLYSLMMFILVVGLNYFILSCICVICIPLVLQPTWLVKVEGRHVLAPFGKHLSFYLFPKFYQLIVSTDELRSSWLTSDVIHMKLLVLD